MDGPDGCDALESNDAFEKFVAATHARCVELAELFPMDLFWYDGWWPFGPNEWRAAELNEKLLAIQPKLLFNPRNGLPGDFATPENHMTAPVPWRPWEGCMTLNESWGHHQGDNDWKSTSQLVSLLAAAAAGRGNLLLNVGPMGDGTIAAEAIERIETVGAWLKRGNAEAIFDTTHVWSFDLQQKGSHRGDWNHHGPCTVKGNDLFVFLRRYPGRDCFLGGMSPRLLSATIPGHTDAEISFKQTGTRIALELPEKSPDPVCSVLRLRFDGVPEAYQTGGQRVPKVPHPHYDPCPSELALSPSH
jgi:alpha-L-fucosidase